MNLKDSGIRYTGWICAPQTGEYTFYMQNNNDAELFLSPTYSDADKQSLIFNTSNSTSWYDTVSAPQFMVGGDWYWIEVHYIKNSATNGRIRVAWSDDGYPIGSSPQIITSNNLRPNTPLATSTPTITTTPTTTDTATATSTPTMVPCVYNGTGILGAYYEDDAPPSFSNLLKVQLDDNIDFDWAYGSPSGIRNDDFAVRWSGYVLPKYPGDYTFYTRTDDGVRLYVDGVRVIDAWGDMSATTKTSDIVTFTTCSRRVL